VGEGEINPRESPLGRACPASAGGRGGFFKIKDKRHKTQEENQEEDKR